MPAHVVEAERLQPDHRVVVDQPVDGADDVASAARRVHRDDHQGERVRRAATIRSMASASAIRRLLEPVDRKVHRHAGPRVPRSPR